MWGVGSRAWASYHGTQRERERERERDREREATAPDAGALEVSLLGNSSMQTPCKKTTLVGCKFQVLCLHVYFEMRSRIRNAEPVAGWMRQLALSLESKP